MEINYDNCLSDIDFVRQWVYNSMCCNMHFNSNIGGYKMIYLSISQMADKWGISRRRVQVLCADGRVYGAMKIGTVWVIPADTPKPQDARVKSGKYIKSHD